MHLKSLTLRGFKSFADPTTMQLEPGVTVIVGPNGSGKSNVVDAVAWVLGAQGPRVLRSSKMDDVIFAGTAKRPALGRAEVSLTIDNSSRRLPVELSEVTVTRTLFRTGESEYAMNGAPCRLLDIQELLSDAGVGRTQHVIMSQGQLASVLDARPEERRAVIEEAAGILKFRRRRERAERRLEATEGNLLRLQDLQREVRRQLRPLERQAEAARRHDSVAAELRQLRLYVAGREIESLRRRADSAEGRRGELARKEGELAERLLRADELIASGEQALDDEQAGAAAVDLSLAERLHERARGLAGIAAERRRRVEDSLAAAVESDFVSSLEAEAAQVDRELADSLGALEELSAERDGLEPPAASPGGRDGTDAEAEATAGRAESLEGTARELRQRRDASAAELAAARERLGRASERAGGVARQLEEIERLSRELAERGEAAASALAALREQRDAAERAERQAVADADAAEARARGALERSQGLEARARVLEEALDEAHELAGVGNLAGREGVLGTLHDLVAVDEGYELAFEAAAADALAAVVVAGEDSARAAVAHLHGLEASGAVLPVRRAAADPAYDASALEALARRLGGVPLRSRVRAVHPGVGQLLDRLLSRTVVCSKDALEALALAEEAGPDAVVVTPAGDRFSARGWQIGARSRGATRAALERVLADGELAAGASRAEAAAAEAARRRWAEARRLLSVAAEELAAADERQRQVAAQRSGTEQRLVALAAEQGLALAGEEERAAAVTGLEARLAEQASAADSAEREAALARADALAAARQARVASLRANELASARSELEVRAAAIEERRALLAARRSEIERRLSSHEEERRGAAGRREAAAANLWALERTGEIASRLEADLGEALARLRATREAADGRVHELTSRLGAARAERSEAEHELAATREQAQRVELERAELRVRLENASEMLRHELDSEVADALAARCPELPPGTPPVARARELERELRLLGPVNPLALEELAGLEERDRFLGEQLEDVRRSRRELGRVMRAVDEEIVTLFAEAFGDVAAHFERLFGALFPGGAGSLSLVSPDDLLSSGVDIEARPAGRSMKRLSLLSGGERALVALAFLFAVFRSRPSPFYLMDEVEAALDDVNLHRFLDLLDEFRGDAQLLVVSHQKRTMESADVIYGVSMQPGGASKVVSERLSRAAPSSASA